MSTTPACRTPGRSTLCAASALLITAIGAPDASAEARTWSATGAKESVVVADCTDCGDDLGMMIACKGSDQPAEVTVHWAATETGTSEATEPISVSVGDATHTYQAKSVYYGQIGHTPEFSLPPGDPLIGALQSGSIASIAYRGETVEIPLDDAATALEIFKVHCGWNAPAPLRTAAVSDADPQVVPVSSQPESTGLSASETIETAEILEEDSDEAASQPEPVQTAQATPQQVTVTLFNSLDRSVDYFYIDAAGQPQFLYTLAPGERVSQPSNPGLELAFGVDGQEIGSYTTTSDPAQDYTVGQQAQTSQPPPPAIPVPQQPAAAPVAGDNGYDDDRGEELVWVYYAGEPGSATLIFGIPETDASVLAVSCEPGEATASAEFLASPQAGLAGQIASVTVSTSAGASTLVAYVNAEGRPVAKVGPQDPLWAALLTPGQAAFSIAGESAGTVDSLAGSTEAGSFFSQCGWS